METTAGTIPPNCSSGSTPGNGSSKLDKAASAVHSAIDEAARKVKPAIDRAATLAHDATDRATSAGAQTADWVSTQTEQLTARQKQLVEDTCKYVAENPLKSLAMAAAAGFLISRILK